MDQKTKTALQHFFSAQKELARLGVIRSRDYIGDIGRHLCTVVYGLVPNKSWRSVGYDGTIGASKVLVVINNCPTGTKVRLEEPFAFDELLVVLGPNSALRPDQVDAEFILYRYTREEAIEQFRTPGGHSIGGKTTFSQGHDRVLSL